MDERFLDEPLKAATVTCIPRLRGGSRRPRRPTSAATATATAATPMSMLDRLRDVALRLIMLSAASKSLQTAAMPPPPSRAGRGATVARMSPSYQDSYRSEAVDECIEFLKRSAARGGAAVEESSPSPLHVPCM